MHTIIGRPNIPVESLRRLHRLAVLDSARIVSQIEGGDLETATPCGPWRLRELLLHMTAQHVGFALAVRGVMTTTHDWTSSVDDPRPVESYADSVEKVLDAFSEDAFLDREIVLPGILPTPFSAIDVLCIHLIDYVVHAWDVAKALGRKYEPSEELAAAALTITMGIADGRHRERPGSAFGPGITACEDSSSIDRIVAALGRSPQWPQAASVH